MNTLEAAIYSRLAGGTALITLLGGTAIYNGQPSRDAALPWVTFQQASGIEDNQTPTDTQRIVYLIKGVASSLLLAGSIGDAIHTLLHHQQAAIGGGSFWVARETLVRYQETDLAGHIIGHAGGEYVFRRQ